MDPISIAMGLATVVPDILKWLGHDHAADSAQKIVDIAQQVTGTGSGDDALAAVKSNPTLALQLQSELDRHSEELAKIQQTTDLAEISAVAQEDASVAVTMQAEDKSDHWPTYSWRPFVGFVFALCVASVAITVMVSYVGVMFFAIDSKLLAYLPQMITSMSVVLALPLPILGVASYFRGKMQANPAIMSDNRG